MHKSSPTINHPVHRAVPLFAVSSILPVVVLFRHVRRCRSVQSVSIRLWVHRLTETSANVIGTTADRTTTSVTVSRCVKHVDQRDVTILADLVFVFLLFNGPRLTGCSSVVTRSSFCCITVCWELVNDMSYTTDQCDVINLSSIFRRSTGYDSWL